jgi:hypothetical protein
MLKKRTEIVRRITADNFEKETETDKRRIESVVLQMLAPIYAPPRTSTPIDINVLLNAVKRCKEEIDEVERDARHGNDVTKTGADEYYPSSDSPYPICIEKNIQNDIVVVNQHHMTTLLRPTPRKAVFPIV